MLSQKIMYIQFCRTIVTYVAYSCPCKKCFYDAELSPLDVDYCDHVFQYTICYSDKIPLEL